MAILGTLVMVLGVVLILLGVIGAAKDVLLGGSKKFIGTDPKVAALFLQVILQVLKGPAWLIMIVLGGALFYFGNEARIGGWPFGG